MKIGEPDIKREGKDLTILTVGATLYRVTKAADILKKYGISTESSTRAPSYRSTTSRLSNPSRRRARSYHGRCLRTCFPHLKDFAVDQRRWRSITSMHRRWSWARRTGSPAIWREEYFFRSRNGSSTLCMSIMPLPSLTTADDPPADRERQEGAYKRPSGPFSGRQPYRKIFPPHLCGGGIFISISLEINFIRIFLYG